MHTFPPTETSKNPKRQTAPGFLISPASASSFFFDLLGESGQANALRPSQIIPLDDSSPKAETQHA